MAGSSWYVTLPEDMSFSEQLLQKDGSHNPGMPTEPTSCFVFKQLSFCRTGSSCPFWLLLYFPRGFSLSAADLKFLIFRIFSMFLATRHHCITDLTVSIVPSPLLSPMVCGGSHLCFSLALLLASGTLTSSPALQSPSLAPLIVIF